MESKNLKKKDKKITIITLTFSMNDYEKNTQCNRQSTTTQDLLDLMNKFGKKHNSKNEVTVHFVDDLQKTNNRKLQKTETDTCGKFQLYFYVNLVNPLENNRIISDKNSCEKNHCKALE